MCEDGRELLEVLYFCVAYRLYVDGPLSAGTFPHVLRRGEDLLLPQGVGEHCDELGCVPARLRGCSVAAPRDERVCRVGRQRVLELLALDQVFEQMPQWYAFGPVQVRRAIAVEKLHKRCSPRLRLKGVDRLPRLHVQGLRRVRDGVLHAGGRQRLFQLTLVVGTHALRRSAEIHKRCSVRGPLSGERRGGPRCVRGVAVLCSNGFAPRGRGGVSALRCEGVQAPADFVDKLQALLERDQAINRVVRVTLLHANEELSGRVDGQARLGRGLRNAGLAAVLCSNGCVCGLGAQLGCRIHVGVCYDSCIVLVTGRSNTSCCTQTGWPVEVRREGVQSVHGLRAGRDARWHGCLGPLVVQAFFVKRYACEHGADGLTEPHTLDVLLGINLERLLSSNGGSRGCLAVKTYGKISGHVALRGRKRLHDSIRRWLRQQDGVSSETSLLFVRLVRVPQDDHAAHEYGKPQ